MYGVALPALTQLLTLGGPRAPCDKQLVQREKLCLQGALQAQAAKD